MQTLLLLIRHHEAYKIYTTNMDISHEISALEALAQNEALPENLRAEIRSQIRSIKGKVLGINKQKIGLSTTNPRVIVHPKQSTLATPIKIPEEKPTKKTRKTPKTPKAPKTLKAHKRVEPKAQGSSKKHRPITTLPPFTLLSSVSMFRT